MELVYAIHQNDLTVEYVPQVVGRSGEWLLVRGPFDKD